MAMVKTADNNRTVPAPPILPIAPLPAPAPAPAPTPPTGLPNSLRRPPQVATSLVGAVAPLPEPETNPARPRLLRGTTSSPDNVKASPGLTSIPMVVRLDPPSNYDDDDSEAKTIPAAALPDEIKALRAKLMGASPSAPQRQTEQQASMSGPPSVVVAPEQDPRRPVPPSNVKTIPAGPLAGRTNTGETLSITSKGFPETWTDEEPEAKTAIGLPFEAMRRGDAAQRRPVPSAVTEPARSSRPSARVEDDDDDDFRETVAAATGGRSAVVVVAILVPLFIAAVLAVLYAAGLHPFERSESPPANRPTINPMPKPGGG